MHLCLHVRAHAHVPLRGRVWACMHTHHSARAFSQVAHDLRFGSQQGEGVRCNPTWLAQAKDEVPQVCAVQSLVCARSCNISSLSRAPRASWHRVTAQASPFNVCFPNLLDANHEPGSPRPHKHTRAHAHSHRRAAAVKGVTACTPSCSHQRMQALECSRSSSSSSRHEHWRGTAHMHMHMHART